MCEVTAGAGDCSIRAGIEEANGLAALGDPRTVVIGVPGTPSLDYPFHVPTTLTPVEVTGNVRIIDNDANVFPVLLGVTTFHVAEGATLELVGLVVTNPGCDSFCVPRGEAHFVVDGTLVLRQVRSFQGGTHVLKVNPTGVAHLEQSRLHGELFWGPDGEDGTQAILNAGITILDRTSVDLAGVEGSVTTVGDGRHGHVAVEHRGAGAALARSRLARPARGVGRRVRRDAAGVAGRQHRLRRDLRPDRPRRRQRSGRPLTDPALRRHHPDRGARPARPS